MNFASIVSNSWSNITSGGAPDVVAAAEQYAADQLGVQPTDISDTAAQIKEVVAAPPVSGGVMTSVTSVAKKIATVANVKTYGVFIGIGAALLILYAMTKKGHK